jgi:DNA helicase IV
MKFKVGDKVLHSSRRDLGFGRVGKIYPDNTCDVIFGGGRFSGLAMSDYVCAKEAIQEAVRTKILARIKAGDFDGARKNYREFSAKHGQEWWPDFSAVIAAAISVYEAELKRKQREEQARIAQERERLALQALKVEQLQRQAVLIKGHLDNNFLDAEALSVFPGDHWQSDFAAHKIEWLQRYFSPQDQGNRLSDEQLRAIGDCSKTCLLRARAGSGKTTVIKRKVDFLLRHVGFNPEDLMVLAFNKQAASKVKKELQTEFNHLTFQNARTFHSLAHQLVQPKQDLLFDINSGSSAKQSQFVERLLRLEMNPAFQKTLYQFFRREMAQLETMGSLLTKEDYYTLRRNSSQDTLGGESVKSLGEKWLADFLFEHGIAYTYERSWFRDRSGDEGNYYPDFSLMVASNRPDVVIEHWGIDEFDPRQSVPEHWSQTWLEYRTDMGIKRQYWTDYNERNPDKPVVFVETSIRDTIHGREHFESVLHQRLQEINVFPQKQDEAVLLESVVRKHTARFAGMCLQYIQKAKKQCLSPLEIDTRINSYSFSCEKEKLFNIIANRIYHRYQMALLEQNSIDFDDLMDMAVEEIHEKKGNVFIPLTRESSVSLNDIKWLMIDEYQDFSRLFFNLVSAIRQYNPTVRLFCVGDNWQAINGFAGSDLSYFDQFDQHFSGATLLDLQNNYRSQPNVVAQGNRFMAKVAGEPSIAKASYASSPLRRFNINKVFIEQRRSVPLDENPDRAFLSHIDSRGEKTSIDPLGQMARQFKLCHQLMSTHHFDRTHFMILARTNNQGNGYKDLNSFKRKLKQCFTPQELSWFKDFDQQVSCTTAHSSKGAEADVVIILNVTDRKFPTVHPDNQLYGLLGDSLEKVYKEEERLFYVAITRAKQALYLFTETGRESEYLDRIETPVYEFPRPERTAAVQAPTILGTL